MGDVTEARFVGVVPEIRYRWISDVGILVVAGVLALLMTFRPFGPDDSSGPQWLWLLGGVGLITFVCFIRTARIQTVRTAARSRVRSAGGLAVLLSAVAVSGRGGVENRTARMVREAECGWLWMTAESLTVFCGDRVIREAHPGDVANVSETVVWSRHLFEPQLKVTFSDGSILMANPVREGFAGIFPFGDRKLSLLRRRIEGFQ